MEPTEELHVSQPDSEETPEREVDVESLFPDTDDADDPDDPDDAGSQTNTPPTWVKRPNREGSKFKPRPPGVRQKFENNSRGAVLMRAEAGEYSLEIVPQLEVEREWSPPSDPTKVVVFRSEDDEIIDLNMFITKGKGRNRSFVIPLTSMTEQELLCLRDAVVAAVELVLPTARELDAKAKTQDASDGRLNRRNYRGVPAIHTNSTPSRVYIESLHHKLEEPFVLAWPAGLGPRRTRVQDDAVAERSDPNEKS